MAERGTSGPTPKEMEAAMHDSAFLIPPTHIGGYSVLSVMETEDGGMVRRIIIDGDEFEFTASPGMVAQQDELDAKFKGPRHEGIIGIDDLGSDAQLDFSHFTGE